MKKNYNEPILKIENFSNENIVTASGDLTAENLLNSQYAKSTTFSSDWKSMVVF